MKRQSQSNGDTGQRWWLTLLVAIVVLVAVALGSFKGADLLYKQFILKPVAVEQITSLEETESPDNVQPIATIPSDPDSENPLMRELARLDRMQQCLTLLKHVAAQNPELVKAVLSIISQAKANGIDLQSFQPYVMVVSYRQREDSVTEVVVQFFLEPQADKQSVLNEIGYARNRLGDELFDAGNKFLSLLYHRVEYLGDEDNVRRYERAFNGLIEGDTTLLREQTVEPLRMLVIVPQAYDIMPLSIRSSVQSLVVKAELRLPEWQTQLEMFTRDPGTAGHVQRMFLTWREMAMLMAAVHAGHTSGDPLREFVKTSSVEVVDNQVVAIGTMQAKAVVRGSKEISGHAPPLVTICHKGRTLQVPETAVAAHLAHGDSLGPCEGNGKVIICHKGKTIEVDQSTLAAHLAHGDTLGPCPGDNDRVNNDVGNGPPPQPPANPPVNDGPGTRPGNPGNRGGR